MACLIEFLKKNISRRRHNGQQSVTSLGLLKMSKLGFSGTSSSKNRKEELAKEREYQKKRKAKKLERFKVRDGLR